MRSGASQTRAAGWHRLLLAATAALALFAPVTRADGSIPAPTQASIFRKLFGYDAALRQSPRIKVLVLHGRVLSGQAREVAAAFEEAGLPAIARDVEAAAGADQDTVLYVLPDVPAAQVRELAVTGGLLTVSGEAALAEQGQVSVALRRRPDGSAQILVNLARLRAEKHELSARLLTLATVLP